MANSIENYEESDSPEEISNEEINLLWEACLKHLFTEYKKFGIGKEILSKISNITEGQGCDGNLNDVNFELFWSEINDVIISKSYYRDCFSNFLLLNPKYHLRLSGRLGFPVSVCRDGFEDN